MKAKEIKQMNEEKYGHREYTLEKKGMKTKIKLKLNKEKNPSKKTREKERHS